MKLNFPILYIITKTSSMVAENDPQKLGSCTNKSLKRGVFDKMMILDSTGKVYLVRGILGVKPLNPFWQWPLEFLLHSSRVLKADLDLELIEQKDLNEAKEFILEKIKLTKEQWESGPGVKTMLKDIERAKNMLELIRLI